MMMMAAGAVPAAKILLTGVGVADLQEISTSRRLSAITTSTDVGPGAKEQVELLGAKFLAVEHEEFKQARTAGGYVKEMSNGHQAKQAELIAGHIAKQDIVIAIALIPDRPAPKLIAKAMVESVRPGSVIIDLAVERGGNCELARPNETVTIWCQECCFRPEGRRWMQAVFVQRSCTQFMMHIERANHMQSELRQLA